MASTSAASSSVPELSPQSMNSLAALEEADNGMAPVFAPEVVASVSIVYSKD